MDFWLLETLPISGIYVFVVFLMLLSGEIGYQFGRHAQSRKDKDAPAAIGPMVAGLMGMLAFVLAFTFSMAASQHDLRKQNVLKEANAIGTAYLRADLLEPPLALQVKRLLHEYVDIRLKAAAGADMNTAIAQSVDLQNRVWAQVSSAALENPNTNTALMIQALNDVIDMHETRISGGLRNRIPVDVWIALAAIITLSMLALGAQVGFSGKRRLVAELPMILAFAVLVTLVVDLNRPQSGLITIGQESMMTLQKSMGGTLQ